MAVGSSSTTQRGMHGDHACDGDALLLTARQAVRRLRAVLIHADGLERVIYALSDFGRRDAHVFERERDIFFNDRCRRSGYPGSETP